MSFLPPSITPKEYYNHLYSPSFQEKINRLPNLPAHFRQLCSNPSDSDILSTSQDHTQLEEHRVALINLMDCVGTHLEGEEHNIFLEKACAYIENHFEEFIHTFIKKKQQLLWELLANRYGTNPISPIVEITTKNIESFLQEHAYVLLDFWGPWFSPHKMLHSAIDKLIERYRGKVAIGKVNVEEDFALAERYQVASIPSLLFLKKGKVEKRITCSHSPEAICQWLDNVLK